MSCCPQSRAKTKAKGFRQGLWAGSTGLRPRELRQVTVAIIGVKNRRSVLKKNKVVISSLAKWSSYLTLILPGGIVFPAPW
jgi:hypothetical protein